MTTLITHIVTLDVQYQNHLCAAHSHECVSTLGRVIWNQHSSVLPPNHCSKVRSYLICRSSSMNLERAKPTTGFSLWSGGSSKMSSSISSSLSLTCFAYNSSWKIVLQRTGRREVASSNLSREHILVLHGSPFQQRLTSWESRLLKLTWNYPSFNWKYDLQ